MITSFKLYNLIFTSKCTSKSHTSHSRFRPRSSQSQFFNRRKTAFHKLCQFHFLFRRQPKRSPIFKLSFHNFQNLRIIMSQNHRSPRSNHIHIFIPIFIIKFTSISTFNKNRILLVNRLKCPNWTIYSTRN